MAHTRRRPQRQRRSCKATTSGPALTWFQVRSDRFESWGGTYRLTRVHKTARGASRWLAEALRVRTVRPWQTEWVRLTRGNCTLAKAKRSAQHHHMRTLEGVRVA